MEPQRRPWMLLAAVAAALVAVPVLILWLTQPGAGPAPIAWDRAACAYCRMHIGDRQFAAQLWPRDGEPVNFDDPGCLFRYLDERSPDVAALYFRHESEDRWVSGDEVRFRVGVERTPMGFGVAAVSAETSGALTLEAARAWAREHPKGRRP